VNPFRVRHVDTHEAKGVLRTWVLLELDLGVIRLSPVDRPRIELLRRVGGEDADALLLEILRLLAQLRNEIEMRNAVRHAPVGEKVQRLDGRLDGWRLPFGA